MQNITEEDSVRLVEKHGGRFEAEAYRLAAAEIIREENREQLALMCHEFGRGLVGYSAVYLQDQYFKAEVAGDENIIKEFLKGDPNSDDAFIELAQRLLKDPF